MTDARHKSILTAAAIIVLALAAIACAAGCGNTIAPTTQPVFGPDSVHVTIIVEKVDVPVSAPINATANITVNGHVFSATAPASQPEEKK